MSTKAAMIPRHSAPAPKQMPMIIGREKLEEEPAEEESVAPGKGGNGVVDVVEFAINTETELAGVDVAAIVMVVVTAVKVLVVLLVARVVVEVAVVAVVVAVVDGHTGAAEISALVLQQLVP